MRNRLAFCAGAAGLLLLAPAGWGQTPRPQPPAPPSTVAWERDDWNPGPEADDVVLPLPCNGALALRRVFTGPPRPPGASNQLEDRQVTLGSADDPLAYVGYLRGEFVAGGFFTPQDQRYYLIGKYEVTVQQYQAVMGDGGCRPPPSDRTALPVSNISWFDAVEFTRRLNKWLYEQRLDALPKSAGRSGFVRLPSETEWEFAARGGMAVSDAERGNSTFVPANANVAEYVWFAGPESAAGAAKPIGSLKPNPLKLYDMLGNVEEIMLEPFRLNRVGRLHGQQGGIVVRGGSYMTPRESIRVSARTEFAPFEQTTKSEMKLPTFGFRIVVSATALSRSEQVAAIKKEWEDARRTETSVAGKSPLQLLEGLLKRANTPAEKAQLQAAMEQFNAEAGRRNEMQGRAIKSLLSAATTIRSNLNFSASTFDQLSEMIEEGKRSPVVAELGRRAEVRFKEQKPKFDSWATTYADLVRQLASDFRDSDVRQEAGALAADLVAQKRAYEGPGLEAVAKDVAAYRDGRMRETTQIIRSAIGPRRWLTP
jgi:hypothetical protein